MLRNLVHLAAVAVNERRQIGSRLRVRGDKHLGVQRLYPIECIEIRRHVVDERDLVFLQCRLAAETIGHKRDAVRRAHTDHIKEMARQRDDLQLPGKVRRRDVLRVALRRKQKLVAQILAGIAAIQERRLQNRAARKRRFDAVGKNTAAGLLLKIAVSADVISVGVRIDDAAQLPAALVEQLAHAPAGLLIVTAVDQPNVGIRLLPKANFRRAVDIPRPRPDLTELIHGAIPLSTSSRIAQS